MSLFDVPDDLCEYSGHQWEEAGGGLWICMQCEAEAWDAEVEDDEDE